MSRDPEYDSDYNADPIGHLKRGLDELRVQAAEQLVNTKYSQALEDYGRSVGELEEEFSRGTPDYHNAREYAANKLRESYRAIPRYAT